MILLLLFFEKKKEEEDKELDLAYLSSHVMGRKISSQLR